MITAAEEGWGALYDYDGLVIERMVAAWVYYPGLADDPEAMLFAGMVIDDNGELKAAHLVERFICYKAPDDKPEDIIKRRAAR